MAQENIRGMAEAVPYERYGINDAGPWSDATSDPAHDFGSADEGEIKVTVEDAAPWTLENVSRY